MAFIKRGVVEEVKVVEKKDVSVKEDDVKEILKKAEKALVEKEIKKATSN